MKTLSKSVHCYLDSARGQYIPRDFARDTKRECIEGIEAKDLDYLARGPGGVLDEDQSLADGETERGEFYWDTWTEVCDNAILICPVSGNRFRLQFIAKEELQNWTCADCSQESYFAHNNDATNIGGDVLEYTFVLIGGAK
jgi:hypothetical protein